MANVFTPPPINPALAAQLGMQNPFMPPQPPPPSPSLGFQVWASSPDSAMKVQHAMTPPNQPLQPNAGQVQPSPMASANPPQPKPMAAANPPQINAPQAQLGQDQARLQQLQTEGAGLNKIQNPIGRGFARAGDIALSVLSPGIAALVPGTTLHNKLLQNQAGARVSSDQGAIQQNLQNQETQANTQHLNTETQMAPRVQALKEQQASGVLAQHGLTLDENGAVTVDENSPTYQKQQLANQLLQSTSDLKRAQTAFEQMKGDPKSQLNQQIAQRLQIAKQTQDRLASMAGAMQERADAQLMNATREAKGTDLQGNPLPGAMVTDDGRPVGSSQAANVRPTGTQRAKGNMAESADQQINDMKSIVANRPDVFGPAAGRKTDFTVWLGSQDPDAQRFRAARTIAGDHLAGTFGGRSEAALNALDSAIGHFRDNPAAVTAGLNQLQEANHLFLKAGKVKTVGSAANPMQPPAPGAPAGSRAFTDGGITYHIPAAQVAAFKKDHPNAR